MPQMPRIALGASPQENGSKHGSSFKEDIHGLAEIRKDLLHRYLPDMAKSELESLCRKQTDILAKHPDLYTEFVEISRVSGLSLEDLVVLNNYTDIRDFDSPPMGCSVFSIRNQQGIFCGQTWDMHASAQPFMLHLSMSGPAVKIPCEILTVTGCLALSGVNAHGVTILINNLNSTETSVGLMWPALVRLMLEQKSAAGALEILQTHLPCSGHNYLVCDPAETINIETTGRRAEVTYRSSNQGVFFHTNHYLGTLASTENKKTRSLTTQGRYKSLTSYFSKAPLQDLTREKLVGDLFLENGQGSVCVAPTLDPEASATCGGIFADLSKRTGFTYSGLYSEGRKFEFSW